MKRVLTCLLLALLLLFTSCSGLGGSNSAPKEDKSGEGLEVDFDLDDSRILSAQLFYEITLENSGLKEIELSQDNFELTTDKTVDIFTSTSLNDFYDDVLSGSTILYHDEVRTHTGILEIDEVFFDETVLEGFEYRLRISYDYETTFNNNIEIDLNARDIDDLLNLGESASQAAPIQIRDIEMVPDRDEEYLIRYYFDDRGSRTFSDSLPIEIEDLEIYVGDREISSRCTPMYKDGNFFVEVESGRFVINEDQGDLIAECGVDFDLTDTFNTKTYGSFTYEYRILETGTITLPDKDLR